MTHPAASHAARLVGLTARRVIRDDAGSLGLILEGAAGVSYLRVGDAAWRLKLDGTVVDGSYEEGGEATGRLEGATIEAFEVNSAIPDTTVSFDGGIRLEILATSANHAAWYRFQGDRRYLTVGPGDDGSESTLEDDHPLMTLLAEGFPPQSR